MGVYRFYIEDSRGNLVEILDACSGECADEIAGCKFGYSERLTGGEYLPCPEEQDYPSYCWTCGILLLSVPVIDDSLEDGSKYRASTRNDNVWIRVEPRGFAVYNSDRFVERFATFNEAAAHAVTIYWMEHYVFIR